VYRIIQEAINNTMKHANASKIDINVIKEKSTYQIAIKDNGKGFEEAETVSGNGMNNLKKRAKEINGEISVTSQKQSGTTIVLRFKKP